MATATELFESGMAALGRGDFLAATQAFQEFVDLDPDNADAWLYLGMAVLPRNFARARAALDRALAIAPGHVGVLYWRAEADWLDGNPLAASEFCARLPKWRPMLRRTSHALDLPGLQPVIAAEETTRC